MKVTYLDLKTGRKASENGISEFQLTENNWSCDCNREIAFGDDDEDEIIGTCSGCKRYIAIQVEPEGDEEFNEEKVLAEANSEYLDALNRE